MCIEYYRCNIYVAECGNGIITWKHSMEIRIKVAYCSLSLLEYFTIL